MKFGELPVAEAEGAILAHSVRHGRAACSRRAGCCRWLTSLLLRACRRRQRSSPRRLAADDVPEDEAAAAVAQVIAGEAHASPGAVHGPRQSPCHRAQASPSSIRTRFRALNRLHESLTLATVAPFAVVDRARDGGDRQGHPLRRAAHRCWQEALGIMRDRAARPRRGFPQQAGRACHHQAAADQAIASSPSRRMPCASASQRWAARSHRFAWCAHAHRRGDRSHRANCRRNGAIPSWSSAPRPSSTGATSSPRP